MDQREPDTTISLRAYAAEDCPEEAAALTSYDALPKIADDLDFKEDGVSWVDSEYLDPGPLAVVARSSLRSMSTMIVDAAAARRCTIWREGAKLPPSFFVDDRGEALALIERALEQDDRRFHVLRIVPRGEQPASADVEAQMKDWADRLCKKGEIITEGMVAKQFPSLTVRACREFLNAKVPARYRAKRGTPPHRRRPNMTDA
jgi:hypothetical protein